MNLIPHPIKLRLFLKLCGWAVLISLLAGCSRKADDSLPIIYSGSLMGYLEPCGCKEGRVGGMARLASAVRDSQKTWDSRGLILDAGDFAEMYSFGDDSKNRTILESFRQVGYDAVNVAPRDLMAGLPVLRWAADSLSLPLISANLRSTLNDSLIFPPWTIKTVAGKTVGIIGAGTVRPLSLRMARAENLTYSDPEEVVRRTVAELRPRCDYIILLCDFGARSAREIGLKSPGIDLIISSMELLPSVDPKKYGGSYILGTSRKGTRLTSIRLQRLHADSLRVEFSKVLLDSTFEDDPAVERILKDYHSRSSKPPPP